MVAGMSCYCKSQGMEKRIETLVYKKDTSDGNRTRAACLEGKHDNHFTTDVTAYYCPTEIYKVF